MIEEGIRREVTTINSAGFEEEGGDFRKELRLDWNRAMVMVKKKNYNQTLGSYLGFIWLVLDPLIMTLVYLFVFTVIRYNESAGVIFIGLGMIRGMQRSLSDASNPSSLRELNGPSSIFRPRTRVGIISGHAKLAIDSMCMASGISIVLIWLGADVIGSTLFLFVMLLNSLVWYYIGICLLHITVRVPDVHKLVNYFGMGMFFASPVLYSFNRTTGLHREFSMYNPMTYTIELGRSIVGLENGIDSLPLIGFLAIILMVIVTAIIGMMKLDSLRWHTSVVS